MPSRLIILSVSWTLVLGLVVINVYACPESCSCSADLRIIECVQRGLQSIPTNIPPQTEELHLHRNNISRLDDGSFGNNTKNLTKLFLPDNELEIISSKAFDSLPRLQVLDLSQNRIKRDVFASLTALGALRELYLGKNQIATFHTDFFSDHHELITLDLHGNNLTVLNRTSPQCCQTEHQLDIVNASSSLEYSMNLTLQNDILNQTNQTQTFVSQLRILDLSHNNISHVQSDTFTAMPNVHTLNLSNNAIDSIDANCFSPLVSLRILDISRNPIATTSSLSFGNNTLLEEILLNDMPSLIYLNHRTFQGLSNLTNLELSHNRRLFYIHGDTFSSLTALRTLDLSHNGLTFFSENLIQNLTNLTSLHLQGNPWSCDCSLYWLRAKLDDINQNSIIKDANNIKCHEPDKFQGIAMVNISSNNWTCTPAKILNYTSKPYFKIGSSAILNCHVVGDPSPTIVWVTPRKKMLIHEPDYIEYDKTMPHDDGYHTSHQWHEDTAYQKSHDKNRADRIHLLHNGSLFIDYVMRSDGGPYKCFAKNKFGNESIIMKFRLDYLILRQVNIMSIIVGLCSSMAVFLIAVIIGIARYVAHKCSSKQRQKRKSIREIIGNLDAYKTIQLDKLRNYKNLTVGTLLGHMEKMRENYSSQVTKIKENCTQHMERVRDNYSTQMGKFKDYRSHQIERIRENYHHQLLKTREYSASQLEKLREQYKLQQQHLLKLLEVMNLTNCRGVVEAECLRTESMLFDQELILDLNTHNLHQIKETYSLSSNEYITASSNNSLNSTGSSYSGQHVGGYKLASTAHVHCHAQNEYANQPQPGESPLASPESKSGNVDSSDHSGEQCPQSSEDTEETQDTVPDYEIMVQNVGRHGEDASSQSESVSKV